MKRFIYADRFEPPTLSHQSLIDRASRLFPHLELLVIDSGADVFSREERLRCVEEMTANYANVSICPDARPNGAVFLFPLTPGSFDLTSRKEYMLRQSLSYIEVLYLPVETRHADLSFEDLFALSQNGVDLNLFLPSPAVKLVHGWITNHPHPIAREASAALRIHHPHQ